LLASGWEEIVRVGKRYAVSMINRSAENEQDRRRVLHAAVMTGLGALGGLIAGPAAAATKLAVTTTAAQGGVSDTAVLNFEYLEAAVLTGRMGNFDHAVELVE
jgi:hypothetical protein